MATPAVLELIFQADTSKAEKAFGSIKSASAGVAKGVAAVGAGAAAAGLAAAAAGAYQVSGALNETEQAANNLQAQLGITGDEAAALAQVGRDVFANNWGESIEEANAVLGTTRQLFGDLNNTELQGVTEQAFALRDAFGVEVEGSLAAAQRMAGAFGITAAEAMDQLAHGMQITGEEGGEVALLMQEYSGHLAQLGISGPAAFQAIADGMASGAFEGDKVLDMFKEMNIKMTEGSDATVEALGRLGIDPSIIDSFRSGAISGAEMFSTIQGALQEYEGNIPADLLADTLGTPAEDLGVEVVKSLSLMGESMGELEGRAMEAGNAVNNNLGAAFATLKRTALDAFADLASGDAFGEFKQSVIDGIGTITEALGPAIEQLGPAITALGEGFSSAFGGGEGEGMAGMFESIAAAIGEIDFEAVAAAAQRFGEALGGALKWLIDNKGLVAEWAVKIGAMVGAFALLAPVVTVIGSVVSILGAVGSAIGTVVGIVGGWAAVWGAITTAAGALAAVLTGPVLLAIGAVVASIAIWMKWGDDIKAVLGEIGTAIKDAWDEAVANIGAALDLIGGLLRLGWDAFLREISDKLDAILGAVGTGWQLVTDVIDAYLATLQGIISIAWTTVFGVIQTALDNIVAAVQLWSGIVSDVFSAVMDTIKTVVQAGIAIVKAIFSGDMDAIRQIISDAWEKIKAIWGEAIANIIARVAQFVATVVRNFGELRDKIGAKIEEVKQTIKEKFGTVIEDVIQIGRDILQGLIDGIEEKKEWLRNMLRGVAQIIPEWLRKWLESRSPSQVTFRIGQDVMAGLTLGIENQTPETIKALEQVVKGMVGIIESGVDAILALASLDGKSLSASALDSVVAAVNALRDAFSKPGGLLDAFSRLDEALQDKLAGSAGNLASILKSMADMVNTAGGFADDLRFGVVDLAAMADSINLTLDQLVAIFAGNDGVLDRFAALDEALQEHMSGSAGRLASLLKSLADIVGVAAGFTEDLEFGLFDLTAAADKIDDTIMRLMNWMGRSSILREFFKMAAEDQDDMVSDASAFASLIKSLADIVKTAGSFAEGLEFNLQISGKALDNVARELLSLRQNVIQPLINRLRMSAEDMQEAGEEASALGGLLGAIGSVLKAAEVGDIDAGLEISGKALKSALQQLLTLRQNVIAPFIRDLKLSVEELNDLATEVGAFGAAIAATVGVLKSISELADIATVKVINQDVVDALLAQLLVFAAAIDGLADDIDGAAADAMAKLGPAAESMMQVQALLAGIFENPFMSSSRRLRGAQTSVEFGQLRDPNTFQTRVVDSIKASIATLLGALNGVVIPEDLGERFKPLKDAADAIKSAFDSFNAISIPSRLSEIIAAVNAVSAMTGLGSGGSGGGGGMGNVTNNVHISADQATISSATIPQLGLSLNFTLGSQQFAAATVEGFQVDQASVDRLIQIIDRRRAQNP